MVYTDVFLFALLMRKVPRPFKMPWGKGNIVEEVSITSEYHEPTIQLLKFEDGTESLRFCSYNGRRFSRSPLMIDVKDLTPMANALIETKEIRKLISKLSHEHS